MTTSFLLIPIKVDALCIDQAQQVACSTADFSKMPYFNGKFDVNPDTAYISEDLLSQPFNNNQTLGSGVHLHWALPDSLTRSHPNKTQPGQSGSTDIQFPLVPTQWLITRSIAGIPEKRWLVASDYLYPVAQADKGQTSGSPTFPLLWDKNRTLDKQHTVPFRYIGRSWLLADWLGRDKSSDDYWDGLTAIGYGEPMFTAFYPNCRNVFGFHDAEKPQPNTSYTILGWYRTAKHDICASNQTIEKLNNQYQWDVSNKTMQCPKRLLCHAQIEIGAQANSANADRKKQLQLAVGNTATEALSAFLAHDNASPGADNISILEDQIEALHLGAGLAHRKVDIGAKFKEARHDKSFSPLPGGSIWTIRTVQDTAGANAQPQEPPVTLPVRLAQLLDQLNVIQQKIDSAGFEIESWRERIFADWYKYMKKAYLADDRRDENKPTADQLKYFIEQHGLKPLGEVEQQLSNLQGDRQLKQQAIEQQLADFENVTLQDVTLQQIAGPRFWQPNEPVLLLTGDAVKSSDRHGQHGLLKCTTAVINPADLDKLDQEALKNIDIGVKQALVDVQAWAGESVCQQQPWTPFLLEWEVDFWPVGGRHSNLDPGNRRYQKEHVTNHYQLPENAIDLKLRDQTARLSDKLATHSGTYQGRSLLTPGAQVVLLKQIDAFLKKQQGQLKQQSFVNQLLQIRNNITDQATDQKTGNVALPALAQSLSGFNAAMLGHKQTMQLDIDDPLGFPEYQAFAKTVQRAVGKFNRVAPQPLNNFNPIRSGALRLDRLRLIDTFGQTRDFAHELDKIITTDTLCSPGDPKLITLPPRLVQPARLNFRWFSAGHGLGHAHEDRRQDIPMNSHRATSPVCGWLVCNNLDGSLLVFDSAGQALGYVDRNCHWQPARGSQQAVAQPNQIANPHLCRVVAWLISAGENDETFISQYIDTLDTAIENCEPQSSGQHQDLALLMSRPLAVVRASLNFELKGLPAVNNQWFVNADMLASGHYETDNVTGVDFKVRLGEHRQLDDGLAGYWLESEAGRLLSPTFYSPQGDIGQSITSTTLLPPIVTYTNAELEQFQHKLSLQSKPIQLTMLVDPHGKVHATSGILPTKAIDIPANQYAPALAAMAVSFLCSVVLTPRRDIDVMGDAKNNTPLVDLPLPEEAGYHWLWVEPTGASKGETHPIGKVDRQANGFEQQVLREGWMLLCQDNQNTKKDPNDE
jgi:hypothetical protein